MTKIPGFGFNLGGMRITVDPLLPIVMIFMAWILSERYYPQLMYTQAEWVYWTMGIVSSLFLTFSIFVHEYGHALAARMLKLPLERIHMYLFGGMAELKQRPIRPREEMLIALAGPLASLLFALIAWGVSELTHPANNEAFLVLQFVFYMNLLLFLFNLLPIFPLDGGRAMRAVLWRFNNYYYKASILTFYISMGIIILIFVVAVVLMIIEGLSVGFWAALLAGYLWYTAYAGRDELIYHPKFTDLVFEISDERSPISIIRQVYRMDPGYLHNAVIPVINEGELEYVIKGKDLKRLPDKEETLEHLYRPVQKGFFVDVADESTYRPGIALKAEFLPVVKHGKMLGMSDGHEIRFWLIQHKSSFFPAGFDGDKGE